MHLSNNRFPHYSSQFCSPPYIPLFRPPPLPSPFSKTAVLLNTNETILGPTPFIYFQAINSTF